MGKIKKRKRSDIIKTLESHLPHSDYKDRQTIQWCIDQLERKESKTEPQSTEEVLNDFLGRIIDLETAVGHKPSSYKFHGGLKYHVDGLSARFNNLENKIDDNLLENDLQLKGIRVGIIMLSLWLTALTFIFMMFN